MIEQVFEFTAESRLYWPYLLSSFLIALFFYKQLNLFSKNYWFNKSLFTDAKIFFFNRFLKVFFILPVESLIVFEITKSVLTFTDGEALFVTHWSESLNLFVFSISFFVLDDVLRFLQHVLMHKVHFLWIFHKVHHSAHTLNPLTLYRVHIVELFLASVRRTLGAVVLSGAFLLLMGKFMSFYEILGAHAFYFLFSFLGGNLRHSHIPLSFGFLEYIFISPAQHQLHHSKSKKDYNLNYGACFSIWDQIYGSFKKGSMKQKVNFGLNYSERKSLVGDWTNQNSGPFKEFLELIKIKSFEFLNLENKEC